MRTFQCCSCLGTGLTDGACGLEEYKVAIVLCYINQGIPNVLARYKLSSIIKHRVRCFIIMY